MLTSPNMLEPIYGPELKSILQELEEYYPPITPTPDWTQSQIMYRSGQRSVVEWLIQRCEN
jgi:NADPH-dependent 7-cyano-7-deazaguanine reductase QueF